MPSSPHTSPDSVPLQRYAAALWVLLGLFVLRVLAQALIALGYGSRLPPWEEWFSGLVPYPQLLASQIAIVLGFGTICLQFERQRGFFVRPHRAMGTALLILGSLYLVVMVIRYAMRMSLYPLERWTGGAIPIVFHWVLAGFILVLGSYHRRTAPPPAGRSLGGRLGPVIGWPVAVAGIVAWMIFQLAPTILAKLLDARPADYAVRAEAGVTMTTTDGATLVADVYHPLRTSQTPTILVRIPLAATFTNSLLASTVGRFWAERGYTVVIQGTRGHYRSSGDRTPLIHERLDGLDTLAWLKRQPWFDGRLGMWGGSTFGHSQWAIADAIPSPPEGRSALMVQIASTSFFDMFHPGGAFSLESALFWALRSQSDDGRLPSQDILTRGYISRPPTEADDRAGKDIPFFDDWVTHVDRDEYYWSEIDGANRTATVTAPVLLMGGWFDPFLPGQLDDFIRIRRDGRVAAAAGTRLLVGPWGHARTVDLPGIAPSRSYRLESLQPSIPWFDRHLLGRETEGFSPAPVRLYVMGANAWRDEQEWPLARARETSWFLHSDGHANTSSGDGQLTTDPPDQHEPPDVFLSDPDSPVPTRGGASLGAGGGTFPQNDIEARADVLVYTTPPLESDLEVTGPVSMVLFVAVSSSSADFTAKLVDVHDDGTAYNVSDGILRQSYEKRSIPTVSGTVPITVQLWPTSMVFKKGHRIRLEVSGSNVPRFDRNPNTGESASTARTAVTAIQAVHHGRDTASRLILPVIPPSGSQP
jgi:putative CocE/NonD family hydrolase